MVVPTFTVPALILSLCFAQSPDVPTSEAEQLFQRVLTRLSKDSPVAGTFRLDAQMSQESRDKYLASARADAKQRGLGLIPHPPENSKTCRWAWDGEREMFEGPDDPNDFEGFFATREAFLDGMVQRNYNLTGPKDPYAVRPASFYFLVGTLRWTQIAKEVSVDFEKEIPLDAPPNSTALLVTNHVNGSKIRLFVGSEDDRPQGHDVILDQKIFHRLRIDGFSTHPDGRAFPNRAKLEVFDPTTSKVMKTDSLIAVEVTFPKSELELRESFQMAIPVGSEVHDLLLNKKFTVQVPLDAQEVMRIDGNSDRWEPMDRTTVPEFQPSSTNPATGRNRWIVVNCALLTVIGAYFAFRAIRSRR